LDDVHAATKHGRQELLEVIANAHAEIESARSEVEHTVQPRSWP
jgi:hypothetical protein